MSEREIVFTGNEREQIGLIARQAAELGEDFVYDLGIDEIQFIQSALRRQGTSELKALFPETKIMLHEIDVITEVVRQARVIMQFEGKDDLSILDRQR